MKITFCVSVLLMPLCCVFLNSKAQTYQYDQKGRLTADASEQIASIEWNNQSKIVKLTRTSGSVKPDLEFAYDAAGNRVLKIVKPRKADGLEPQDKWRYTYYEYDRVGKVIAIYTRDFQLHSQNYTDSYKMVCNNLYVGGNEESTRELARATFTANVSDGKFLNKAITGTIIPSASNQQDINVIRGDKNYELTNFQMSVVATIADRRSIDSNNQPKAIVTSATDYYPFGMTMADRKNSTDKNYRYGFQKMEKDDEVMGENNSYDFGGRSIYSARLARFVSVDPLWNYFPELSPYLYAINSPIAFMDKDGGQVTELQRADIEKAKAIGPQTKEQLKHMAKEDAKALVQTTSMVYGPAAGAGYVTTALVSGTVNATAETAIAVIDGEEVTADDVGTDFLVGASFGVGGKLLVAGIEKGVKAIATLRAAKTVQTVAEQAENSMCLANQAAQDLMNKGDEVEEIMLAAIKQPAACFVGDTEILTAGHKFVYIKDISVEKEIYRLSEEDLKMLGEERAALEYVVEVTLDNLEFTVEEDQLFIVNDEWKKAIDLVVGDKLLKLDGTTVEVKAVKKIKKATILSAAGRPTSDQKK